MSILGNIVSAIVGSARAAGASGVPSTELPATTNPQTAPSVTTSKTATAGEAGAAATAPLLQVDVEAVLTALAAKKAEKLDWRRSIVDLMKLLELDSSLTARKRLAKELNYAGNIKNSAAMNLWLHKQVMIKLAASGGKVPDDLKA